MKNILLVLSLVFTNIVVGQKITVKNDTVFIDTTMIGNVTYKYETFINIGGGESVVKQYTLTTLYVFNNSTIKLIKKELYGKYGEVKIKQGGTPYMNTITYGNYVTSRNTIEAGKAIKNSVTGQILQVVGIPIMFIHPVVGGIVSLSGFIYSVSELNRAGTLMMNEM